MTARDKKEIGSRFWNQGKFDNYVKPFIMEDVSDKTFVDMGCNSGLFLKLAEDMGFKKVIGVDSDHEAIVRGREWRDKTGGNYTLIENTVENAINSLPIVDYTVLANVHYYTKVNDWMRYLDQLSRKSRFCVIVTAEKRHLNRCWASADLKDLRSYFRDWEEVGFVNEFPNDGDPSYRRLWGLCFKSRHVDRVPTESLDSGNHVQDKFYAELDEGKSYKDTKYYRIIKKYRLEDRKDWTPEQLEDFFIARVKLYDDIKSKGLTEPIYIDSNNLILDGNHRYQMLKHLGNKSVFVRRV